MSLVYCADRPHRFFAAQRRAEADLTHLVHAHTRALLADVNIPTFDVVIDLEDLPLREPLAKRQFPRARCDRKRQKKGHRR